MIEMEYQTGQETKILENNNYRGFDYYIISYGTHPCVYVQLGKNNYLFQWDYNNINISCHGGLTYSENHLGTIVPESEDVWILGWDYAHDGDKFGDRDGKEWTTKEIREEVHQVIENIEYFDEFGELDIIF